ncbi:DUF4178 domain-containing protein [Alysiella filiformis]|uniref:DUF4178 domain-containing protein n=1 Tax=Alysiella filiformis DSM 16848 TaxID=1120981 RepID=A0A286E9U8_9NEIS|nr:DUF4178 domain-containing protein [Alysiella filiformis]QMT31379.1 DUF4178 domain-containing protein [Alysiella filiformis]UBQ55612.1 DUF4178 domain-containing protein [Alysiella filiformis DSM 16848]SOD67650.1 protein of unknown function [Alysiella filiformis DSM 16848]
MSEPLFHTSCPSCGAPVHVHSATAVTVVCGYCNSMLVRQDDSLHDTGRDSALLTDFSPLQIGTTGRFAAQGFTLIGRLQARYEQGVWNEWYARFDDGSHGWLSEAGDLYVFVRESDLTVSPPKFGNIRAGETTLQIGKIFVASDVRDIVLENAAAQGELPFRLPEKLENRVADFRAENLFLTLDYATEPPQLFMGKTVQLADLVLQNLKDERQIQQQAGSLKGLRQAENCPNCGGSIHWVGGVTQNVICQHCGSDLDTSETQAQLRQANAMRQAQDAAWRLPLGRVGKIRGTNYTVIGAVRKEELASLDAYAIMHHQSVSAVPQGWWVEYLLYSPQKGFLWLVEVPDDGWYVSTTLNHFPILDKNLQPQGASKLYAYGGRVSYAAGAFYWHIRAGDVNHYTDYAQGGAKLCAELSPNEWAWSRSVAMTPHELSAFGLSVNQQARPIKVKTGQDEPIPSQWRWIAVGVFVIINLPAWLGMSGDDLVFSAIVSFVVLRFVFSYGKQDEDE